MRFPSGAKQSLGLPEYWTARAVRVVCFNGKMLVVLTLLTDQRRFQAQERGECYRRRWEIETSYRELKQSMLGGALTLRSPQRQGIEQEIWGALIAYSLVRLEMAKAEGRAD